MFDAGRSTSQSLCHPSPAPTPGTDARCTPQLRGTPPALLESRSRSAHLALLDLVAAQGSRRAGYSLGALLECCDAFAERMVPRGEAIVREPGVRRRVTM